jgi:hypothetical protein
MSKPIKRNYLIGVNRILTPSGYKPIKYLKAGDMLQVYDYLNREFYQSPVISIRKKYIPLQFFYKVKLEDDYPTEVVATLFTFVLDNQFKQNVLHSMNAKRLMNYDNIGAGIEYTHSNVRTVADDLMPMMIFNERAYKESVTHDGILCYYIQVANDPYLIVDKLFLRLGLKEDVPNENVQTTLNTLSIDHTGGSIGVPVNSPDGLPTLPSPTNMITNEVTTSVESFVNLSVPDITNTTTETVITNAVTNTATTPANTVTTPANTPTKIVRKRNPPKKQQSQPGNTSSGSSSEHETTTKKRQPRKPKP